jgi:predicted RNase H-like HicB family nuclease
MELEGKIRKNKNHWLVEVPSLNVMTQGESREEALEMVVGAIREYLYYYFESIMNDNIEVTVIDYKRTTIGISSNNNKLLLALSLRRQREKSGLTMREASERMGASSSNAYAQYEKGCTRMSLEQYEKLIQAANPFQHSLLRVV